MPNRSTSEWRELEEGRPSALNWIVCQATSGRELGREIGRQARDRHLIDPDNKWQKKYRKDPEFRSYVDGLEARHREAFPEWMYEGEGFQEAAGVDRMDWFIHQAEQELDIAWAPEARRRACMRKRMRCSDAGIVTPDGQLFFGHNEDETMDFITGMSMVRTPDWFGYVYLGELPGNAVSFNRWGLGISINTVAPARVGTTEPWFATYFILRGILDLKTPDEVVAHIRKYPTGSALSCNVYFAGANTITNIEAYGDKVVHYTRSRSNPGPLCHFNAFLRLIDGPDDDALEDLDEGRAARALKSKFRNAEDVRRFLGHPDVFMDDDDFFTFATFMCNTAERCVKVYRMPPGAEKAIGAKELLESIPWEFSCPTGEAGVPLDNPSFVIKAKKNPLQYHEDLESDDDDGDDDESESSSNESD